MHRLTCEVGRGVGQARLLRYEALNQLLQSPYHDLVASVLRQTSRPAEPPELLRPDERPVGPLLTRSAGIGQRNWQRLRQPVGVLQVQGASYALQGMLVAGGLGCTLGRSLVPMLARAWSRAEGEARSPSDASRRCVEHFPVVLQEEELHDAGVVPPSTPQPGGLVADPQQSSVRLRRLDRPGRPTARLRPGSRRSRCWSGCCSRPASRRVACGSATSAWLIAGSAFASAVMKASIAARDDCPDQASRSALLRTATVCHQGESVPEAEDLLNSHDPADFRLRDDDDRPGGHGPTGRVARRGAGRRRVVRAPDAVLPRHGRGRAAPRSGRGRVPARYDPSRRAGVVLEQGSRILA